MSISPDRRGFFLAAGALIVSPAGFARPAAAQAPKPVPVVASFSILGDLAQEIGGARIALRVLVGPGADAHAFAPGPQDARALSGAKLIFAAGFGFESWLDRLVKSSGSGAKIVWVNVGITPNRADHDHHDARENHDHGDEDPHAWQNVANAKIYVENIAQALIQADPSGENFYQARKIAYLQKLDALDLDIRTRIAALPKDRRKFVTTHEAFGYFASAYGLEIIAPAGMAGDEAMSMSARNIARVVQHIRKDKIPAIFWDNPSNIRIAEQIARESGAKLGGYLYGDALSAPGGPADSYIAMMAHNISEIAKALAP